MSKSRLTLTLASAAFLAALAPAGLRAATVPVTNNADDGSFGTLRYVLKYANDGDVIQVPGGIFVLKDAGATALDYDCPAAGCDDLDINKSVTIQGSTDPSNPTIIDANGPTTGARIFDIDDLDSPDPVGVILSNLIIQNGQQPGAENGGAIRIENEGSLQIYDSQVVGNDAGSKEGGGIYMDDAAFLVAGNTVFSHNLAADGGGIYMDADEGGLTLKGCTFSNNQTTGKGGGLYLNYGGNDIINTKFDHNIAGDDGGAVHIDSTTATRFVGTGSPTGCVISNNSADSDGGGIYADYATLIDNCLITGNQQTSTSNYGGGIYNNEQMEIKNSTISNNHSAGYAGGVYNSQGLTVLNSTISGNIADNGEGGGIFNDDSLAVESSVVSGNVSNAGYGGGIYNDSVYMTINNTAIVGNTALGDRYAGGGIFNEGESVVISNSTIAGNVASGNDGTFDAEGGGVYTTNGGYPAAFSNVTIANNKADGDGGGIYAYDNSSETSINLNNVTITGNVADANAGGVSGGDGGGIFSGNDDGSNFPVTVGFSNTIIAGNLDMSPGNEAPDCFDDYSTNDEHVMNSVGPNIVQDPRGCEILGDEADVQNVDPLFDTAGLADNSGPSIGDPDSPVVLQTIALKSGSPAIDAAEDRSAEATDERGIVRPIDGDGDGTAKSDLGAFEAAAPSGGTTGGTTTGGTSTGGTTGGSTTKSGGCSLVR
jgi:predicted outer membrane repeat protein